MSDSSMDQQAVAEEILKLNERLLKCIAAGDWKTYSELCDSGITGFEPEARGQWVEGMDFHKFYFDLGGSSGPSNTTMCSPMVHVLGGAAVVCYVRLVQKLDESGKPITARCEETRVWHHRGGRWQHVHFHRSVSV